jgi:hypothetical protein
VSHREREREAFFLYHILLRHLSINNITMRTTSTLFAVWAMALISGTAAFSSFLGQSVSNAAVGGAQWTMEYIRKYCDSIIQPL